jgi:hypothetical protein
MKIPNMGIGIEGAEETVAPQETQQKKETVEEVVEKPVEEKEKK